jgi:ribosomal protein L10
MNIMAISISKPRSALTRKEAQIDTITKLAEGNSVIGITDLSGISSGALQGIRASLRSGEIKATIKVAKNTLKLIALEKIAEKAGKKDVKKLITHISGSSALIFSNTNPFKLQQFLNKNKVPAPAKAGQISPVDVFIPDGLTNLDPGPIISELGSIGLQTRIEKGKIRITKTAQVLSVGDIVTENHAAVLTRLGIQPFSVSLKLSQVLDGGDILDGSTLQIDENKIISDLQQAYMNALAVALDPKVLYYSEETIPLLLKNAVRQSIGLSLELNYPTDINVDILLAKTKAQAEKLRDTVSQKDSNIQFEN